MQSWSGVISVGEKRWNTKSPSSSRAIAFHHPDAALDFNISFDIAPIDSGSCTVQVDVRAQPQGWTRILEPVMRRAMPKQGDRITSAMAEVIESAPARTETDSGTIGVEHE